MKTGVSTFWHNALTAIYCVSFIMGCTKAPGEATVVQSLPPLPTLDDQAGSAASSKLALAENQRPEEPGAHLLLSGKVQVDVSPSPAIDTPTPSPNPPPSVDSSTADFDRKSVGIINGCFHHRGNSWFANSRFNEYRDVTEMKGVTLTVNIKPIEEADKLNGVDWNADYYVQCKALRQAYRQLPSPLVKWSDWQNEEGQNPIFCFSVIHRNGQWSIQPKMRSMFGGYDNDTGFLSPALEALPEYGEQGERRLQKLIADAKQPTKTVGTFPFTKYDYNGTTHNGGIAKITDTTLILSFNDTKEKDASADLWYAFFWNVTRQNLGNDDGPWAQFTALGFGESGSVYNLYFRTMNERDAFCTQLNSAILEWKRKYPRMRQNQFRGLTTEH